MLIEEIISHLSWCLKMVKLLVILFIIKLHAGNNIFKVLGTFQSINKFDQSTGFSIFQSTLMPKLD